MVVKDVLMTEDQGAQMELAATNRTLMDEP